MRQKRLFKKNDWCKVRKSKFSCHVNALEIGRKVRVLENQKKIEDYVFCRTYGKVRNDLYFHPTELVLIIKKEKPKQLKLNFKIKLLKNNLCHILA